MKCLYIILINILLLANLHAKTTKELISKIANTSPTMQYLFWVTKDENSKNIAYLSRKKEDSSLGVWYFTPERKWQPIHNADEYDGFDKADNIFDNASIDNTKEMITFTAITKQPIDDVLNKTKLLENNTFNIGWYFWVNDGDAFLFSKRKDKGFNIWYFTSNKKWQPIHNTSEFDGFDKADKTLKDISFEESSGVLNIGGSVLDDNNSDAPIIINPDAFILIIQTDKQGESEDKDYIVSTNPDNKYKYNYSVDCNSDGIKEAENLNNNYTCKYQKIGTYHVSIEGLYPHKFFTDNEKILDIKQWGNIQWEDMSRSFHRAFSMKMSAKDKPDLSKVKNMENMFQGTKSFNQDIGNWDVSRVENMHDMFDGTLLFNQDIGSWDVSRVEDMENMFQNAKSFNQNIGNWDVSRVKNMNSIFYDASSFNQDISQWDVSRVEDMEIMFADATSFNQNIGDWNVSRVKNMSGMFRRATSFNQDISDWNVSKVQKMHYMFQGATSFNQDIKKWKINPKTSTEGMFDGATAMEETNKPEGI